MPAGTALLVGVKTVDPAAYGGWDGAAGCWGCELDADNVERILSESGLATTVLKTAEATSTAVLSGLAAAAEATQAGDLFVFYYSGHGGQQPDFDNDEMDGHDETLVAYDRQIIDDELNEIWQQFKPGVRLVMLSDSCNSGTNYRQAGTDITEPTPVEPLTDDAGIAAQMIHMGGCRDSNTSSGYLAGGAFTMALCNAWANADAASYRELYDAVVATVHTGQQPQYTEYGAVGDQFRGQRPFTI